MQNNRSIRRLLSLALALTLLVTLGAAACAEGNPDAAVVETVTAEGFTMDYIRFGHGEKPLVILPGLSVQSVMGSAAAVAEAYRA